MTCFCKMGGTRCRFICHLNCMRLSILDYKFHTHFGANEIFFYQYLATIPKFRAIFHSSFKLRIIVNKKNPSTASHINRFYNCGVVNIAFSNLRIFFLNKLKFRVRNICRSKCTNHFVFISCALCCFQVHTRKIQNLRYVCTCRDSNVNHSYSDSIG